MPHAPVQPPVTFDTVLTGHFYEKPGYAVQRPCGSHDYLMIFTAAGTGRFDHAPGLAEHTKTRRGDVVLRPPGKFHQYATDLGAPRPKWELLWSHFHPRPAWTDLLRWPGPTPALGLVHFTPDLTRDVEQILRRMHAYASGSHPRGRDLAMTCIEQVLLHATAVHGASDRPAVDPRVLDAMRLLADRPQDPFDLPALAEAVSLSPSRLSHLFRDHAHLTPLEFHERQRVDLARRLLRATSLSIKEISAACGYSSPFYFSRRFKQSTGKSPTAWRG